MKNIYSLFVVFFFVCSYYTYSNKHAESKQSSYRIITVSENGKKAISFVYKRQNSILLETQVYNTENGKIQSTTKYNYINEQFKFISQNDIKDIDGTQKVLDNIYQVKYLRNRGFYFKYPQTIMDEIQDISTIFTITDNYPDIDKHDTITGNIRIIRFSNINKNIKFYPSEIEEFVPQNIIINSYSVWLDKGTVLKEQYKFKSGLLVRVYKYNKGNLIELEYLYKPDNNRDEHLNVKKFIYH